MRERTTRCHKRQRHIHADDAECEETGEGFGGLSVHNLRVLTCHINYAVLHTLSTDGCPRVLQNVRMQRLGVRPTTWLTACAPFARLQPA